MPVDKHASAVGMSTTLPKSVVLHLLWSAHGQAHHRLGLHLVSLTLSFKTCTVELDGVCVPLLLDTVAALSLLNWATGKRFLPRIGTSSAVLHGYGNSWIDLVGSLSCSVRRGNKSLANFTLWCSMALTSWGWTSSPAWASCWTAVGLRFSRSANHGNSDGQHSFLAKAVSQLPPPSLSFTWTYTPSYSLSFTWTYTPSYSLSAAFPWHYAMTSQQS